MKRRLLFRVLLSLVLLVSQQMAIAHAISHWSSTGTGPGEQAASAENSLSRAVAADKTCEQCLAFAQVDTVIADLGPFLVPAQALRFAPAPREGASAIPDAVLFYRPRGPPATA